ncbi:uncharacterized protein LOC131942193 [Physella acuta]|uniref:uncharacterized protein LOC131942193 n=1 Tax=Physella acuta TaxID=109671 RepID=UPI0027DB8F3E|nr:uncharacterized protein LOC131942193 [Physella acuta]
MCIQCSVSNPVGTTWADGCLYVLFTSTNSTSEETTENTKTVTSTNSTSEETTENTKTERTALICVTAIAAISIVINVIGCVIFICRPKLCKRKDNKADTYDVAFDRTGTAHEDEHQYEHVVNEPAASEEVSSDYLEILN